MTTKLFLLYDGRAKHGVDTDDCTILDNALSERSARQHSKSWRGIDAIWFEYDEVPTGDHQSEIHNETPRPDIGKGILL